MTLTEAQAKVNRRPDVHRWHALWRALVFLGWQDRSIELPEQIDGEKVNGRRNHECS